MPVLPLKRTSTTELRLAHSYLGGWIFAAMGLAVAWAGSTLSDDGVGRWMMTGMGLSFALLGIGGGLWRYDLTLDLMARAYRGRRGFWPSPRTLQGSLSELEGVALTQSWRRSSDGQHAPWVVQLLFRGWARPVSVFMTTNESKGYQKLEELARLLHAPAIDRTGETGVVRGHDELDRSIADAGFSRRGPTGCSGSSQIEQPPAKSGIELGLDELGGTMIVLPAAGIQVGTVLLAVFALPFLGFGALALASALGVSPIEVKGTLSAKWIVGGMFTLIGLLLELGAIFGTVAREVIRDEGGAIAITLRAFGRHYHRRELRKREIEQIDVKASLTSLTSHGNKTPTPTELVLRTDGQVVRIAGDQTGEGQRWLADSLLKLVRGA